MEKRWALYNSVSLKISIFLLDTNNDDNERCNLTYMLFINTEIGEVNFNHVTLWINEWEKQCKSIDYNFFFSFIILNFEVLAFYYNSLKINQGKKR